MKKILFVLIIMLVSVCSFASNNTESVKYTQQTTITTSSEKDVLAKVKAERWIKTQLKDPKSYQLISWKAQRSIDDYNTYVVYIKFRAKNSFGGYMISESVVVIYNFERYGESLEGIIR